MYDILIGSVTNVIDGDTFDMSVSRIGTHNKYNYNNLERIRINSVDAPELSEPGGQRSRINLERNLLNRNVRCSIKTRDTFGRLVADVALVN